MDEYKQYVGRTVRVYTIGRGDSKFQAAVSLTLEGVLAEESDDSLILKSVSTNLAGRNETCPEATINKECIIAVVLKPKEE